MLKTVTSQYHNSYELWFLLTSTREVREITIEANINKNENGEVKEKWYLMSKRWESPCQFFINTT